MNSLSLKYRIPFLTSNQMPNCDSPEMSGIHIDGDSAKGNLKGHALGNRFRKPPWSFYLETHHFAL